MLIAADGDETIRRSCSASYASYSGSSGQFAGGTATSGAVAYDTVGTFIII